MSATARVRGLFVGDQDADSTRGTRLLALAGIALLLGATLQVMYHFIDVVGVPYDFVLSVALTLVAATITARYLRPWLAVAVGAVLLSLGLGWYVTTISGTPSPGALLADSLSLFTGETLLRITNIRAWVLGVAPGPVFVTWYFAVRRWYTPAVLAAGATLGFFVLTGDADVITTVTGVVGGTAAIGFGDLERRGKNVLSGEMVVTVVAVMIIVPGVVSVVPASAGASIPFAGDYVGGGDGNTLEGSLTDVDERVDIQGSIELSPEVKFSVTSTEEEYWRVASYDRYTGDGWVRTGGTDPYGGGFLEEPVGPSRMVTQTIRAEDDISTSPAAWRPVQLDGLGNVSVTDAGSFVPRNRLQAGETYTVRSAVPQPPRGSLQNASTDYPDHIEETYLQLPSSTPERVRDRTAALTANAETPYETARTIEAWLESERSYSLDVQKPRGDVADAFLFEMDRGYCTYYATTMVVMLRSEGIPARFVTGYSPGERVAEDRWVVRGQNSHAWVEVYFPDQGWVRFDPTPSGPRTSAEQESLESARASNATGVDTSETTPEGEWTPTPTATPEPLTPVNGTANSTDNTALSQRDNRPSQLTNNTFGRPGVTGTPPAGSANGSSDGGGGGPLLPTRHQLGLGLLALVGLAAGVRRTNAAERLYRAAWVRYQPRSGDPAAQIERAYQRLAYHLESRTYRTRRPGETVREWFDAIDADEDARRVMAIRERARYAGTASASEADEAVETVDRIVR